MKILLVNKFYYRRAGAEAYLLDLEAALKRAGHEVAVFATLHPETIETPWMKYFPPYIPFDQHNGFASEVKKFSTMVWSRTAARAFEKMVDDFKPDVVHIHNIYHHLSPSILPVCKKRNIPVVQTLHDYKFICPNYTLWTNDARCERCHVQKYWNAVLYKCVQKSAPASLAAAIEMTVHRALKVYEEDVARFVTPSAFLRDVMIRWGKEEKKIDHIPNLVDLTRLPEQVLSPGEGVVFVARMEEWKGARVALEIAEAAPDIQFRFIGSGPLLSELSERVRSLKLSNVTFLGFQPREKVYAEMQAARLVLVPSVGYDPFPTTALEAGALMKPVVGSNIGGIPEIVKHGETGLLCPPEQISLFVEHIRLLCDRQEIAMQYGGAAYAHVRSLVDPDQHLQRILHVYEQVIQETRT